MTGKAESDALEKGLKQPLLITSEDKKADEDDDHDIDESEEAIDESRRPATSIGSAYRLLTPSVKVSHWFGISYELPIFIIPLNYVPLMSVLIWKCWEVCKCGK